MFTVAGHSDFEVLDAGGAGVCSGTGNDPVIGQQVNATGTNQTKWRNNGNNADHDFKTHVKLMGGGYFFAPAISFLQRG